MKGENFKITLPSFFLKKIKKNFLNASLISNINFENVGDLARAYVILKDLKKVNKAKFCVLTRYPRKFEKIIEKLKLNKIFFEVLSPLDIRIFRIFFSDLILTMGAELISKENPSYFMKIFLLIFYPLIKAIGIPVIFYNIYFDSSFSKFFLLQIANYENSYIIAREETSSKILNQIKKINKKVKVEKDLGYVLNFQKPNLRRSFVGLNLKDTRFIQKNFGSIIKILKNRLNKEKIAYIPFHPQDLRYYFILKKIFRNKIFLVKEKNPVKIKGIIAKCKFLIGCRYHSLVFADSSGIKFYSFPISEKIVNFCEKNDKEALLL